MRVHGQMGRLLGCYDDDDDMARREFAYTHRWLMMLECSNDGYDMKLVSVQYND